MSHHHLRTSTLRDPQSPAPEALGETSSRTGRYDETPRVDVGDPSPDGLLATLCHELTTPLTCVSGYLEILDEAIHRQESARSQEVERALEAMRTGLIQLEAIVGDLREAGRIDAPIAGRIVPLGLDARIREMVGLVSPSAQERSVALVHRPTAEDTTVEGVPDLVDRVIVNLVWNALKYTPPGGTVTLSTSPAADHVRVQVADTGIGMSPAARLQAFTRSYRAPEVLTRQIDGAGLGLFIVKRIVDQHGGRIDIQSEIGRGTTVEVSFPRVAGDPLPATR